MYRYKHKSVFIEKINIYQKYGYKKIPSMTVDEDFMATQLQLAGPYSYSRG